MLAYLDILLRTILAVLLLLLIPKILGKQTLSNMTFHDFVTGITLGAIAANLAFNKDLKSPYLILSIVVFTLTSLLLSYIALKSRKMRNWISGSPTVLIEGGKILEENMRKIRYTMDTLDQSLRENGIFDIEEVEFAILEDNGVVSILKKEAYQYVTKKDLKLQLSSQSFPVELIMDGRIMERNLHNNGLTKEWLENELRRKGKHVSEVFYAVRGTNQQIVLDLYTDHIEHPIDQE